MFCFALVTDDKSVLGLKLNVKDLFFKNAIISWAVSPLGAQETRT